MKQIKFNRSLVSLITGTLLLAAPGLRADSLIMSVTGTADWGGTPYGYIHGQDYTFDFTLNSQLTTPQDRFSPSYARFSTLWLAPTIFTSITGDGLNGTYFDGQSETVIRQLSNGVSTVNITDYPDRAPTNSLTMGSSNIWQIGFSNIGISAPFRSYNSRVTVGEYFSGLDGIYAVTGSYPTFSFSDINGKGISFAATSITISGSGSYAPAPVSAVPEPSSLALLLIGVIGTGGYVASKRYRRAAQS
jgi:PEP-CTERM motif